MSLYSYRIVREGKFVRKECRFEASRERTVVLCGIGPSSEEPFVKGLDCFSGSYAAVWSHGVQSICKIIYAALRKDSSHVEELVYLAFDALGDTDWLFEGQIDHTLYILTRTVELWEAATSDSVPRLSSCKKRFSRVRVIRIDDDEAKSVLDADGFPDEVEVNELIRAKVWRGEFVEVK